MNCPPECKWDPKEPHEHPPTCDAIEDLPGLMPGWGCCRCRIYNGKQRAECRGCGHARCDGKAEGA